MYGIPATRTPPPPLSRSRGKIGAGGWVKKIIKCLVWRPTQRLPHVCSCHRQEPRLVCVWRTLASLHAPSCPQDWSWGARPLFSLQSPGTPIPDPIPDGHALFSISNPMNTALSVTLLSCVHTKLPGTLYCLSFELRCHCRFQGRGRKTFPSSARYTHGNLLQSPMCLAHAVASLSIQ